MTFSLMASACSTWEIPSLGSIPHHALCHGHDGACPAPGVPVHVSSASRANGSIRAYGESMTKRLNDLVCLFSACKSRPPLTGPGNIKFTPSLHSGITSPRKPS